MISYVVILDDELLEYHGFILPKLPKYTIVILRAYKHYFREKIAKEISVLCKSLKLYFLVAGDAKLAKISKAHGIHINKQNFNKLIKWKFLQKKWIVTASSHTKKENFSLCFFNIDIIIYSPVFKTDTHPKARAIGIKKFAINIVNVKKKVSFCALGGITWSNLKQVTSIAKCKIGGIGLYKSLVYSNRNTLS